MADQERTSLGARIAERLLKRVQRRARVGLSSELLARFGLPDPWAMPALDGPVDGSVDGDMVFLSIKPYLARMQRLAWARRRRELRLARLTERYGARDQARAWRRWPGVAQRRGLAGIVGGGVETLSLSDMHLPPPLAAAAEPAEEAPEASAPRRRGRRSDARTSSSPWLLTPFVPARVAPKRVVPERPEVVVVTVPAERAALSAGAPVAPRPERSLDRVGRRLAASAPASTPLARVVEQSGPALARTARGRRLARELVELAELPEAEQAVQVRRVLRRAGAARRVVVEEIEQALPQAQARPSAVARDRMAAAAGRREARGLRPVMASSPSLQTLAPAPAPVAVEQAEQVGPARPVAVAARRAARARGPLLSTSPVRAPAPAPARGLSTSPMARSRSRAAAAAPSRRSAAAAARLAPTALSTTGQPSSSRTQPRLSASSDDGVAGPAGGDEPPPLSRAAAQAAPASAAADQPSAPRRRATSRAAERLDLVEPEGSDFFAQAEPGAALRLAETSPAPARFAVTRSPQGVYVPATTLARAESAEPAPADEVAAASPGARRQRGTPMPSVRPSPVQPVPSTARVAGRRLASTHHAVARSAAGAARAGSVLPASIPGERPVPSRSEAPLRRRLAPVRVADGTFVAAAAAPAPSPVLSPDAVTTPAVGPATPPVLRDRGAGAPATRQPPAVSGSFDARPELSLDDILGAGSGAADSSVDWAARRLSVDAPSGRPRTSGLEPPAVTSLARPAPAPEVEVAETRAPRRGDAPTVAAARRVEQAPVVAASVQRLTGSRVRPATDFARSDSPAPGQQARTVRTRFQPNPVAYAARYGLAGPDRVVIEVQDLGPEPTGDVAGQPASARRASSRSALDRLDLRALATAEAVQSAVAPPPLSRRTAATAAPGSVLQPDPTLAEQPAPGLGVDDGPAPRRGGAPVRRADGTYVASGQARDVAPTRWAGARTARTSAGRSLQGAPAPSRARGGFDPVGVFRAPLAASRRQGATPTADVARDFDLVAPGIAPLDQPAVVADGRADGGRGVGLRPGLPGAARPAATQVRPDLSVTLGAVDQGVSDKALPIWARRASGEPLIRREDQFIEALARATEPEEIIRVIYQRAARGGMTTAATGLPAPVIQVIEQIRAVAGQVELGGTGPVRGGPSSDAEVVRRSGVRRAAPRSTARVAGGMTALRSRGSATSRDGVGADNISKLSKKLQQLILLAERQRQAARQQVRMAEDSASARAEGHASPGAGEGGTDKHIDIEALGREVLEVVSMELEMRKTRSQEGSDEFGWW